MAKPVTLPTLGPAIEEAILVKWLVAEGAYVKRGDPIFSVETDKTLTDCESLDEGYLTDIAVEEGATVRIDQVLAMLGEQKPGASSTPAITPALKVVESAAPVETPAVADTESVPAGGEKARLRISPRARRSAREAGVPIDGIERIAGSGPDGRIVHRDVAAFVATSVATSLAGAVGGTRAHGAASSALPRADRSRDVPLTPVRRAIARRMTESAQSTPVFYASAKIHSDNLVSLRGQLARARSIDVSINDIVVKACALGLQRHRHLNASFHGEFVRIHDDIDVSVAVALEDGLITPIVRNADFKSLAAIADEIRTLAKKARSGQLTPAEYQGGSFTVSNLGMFGVDAFTAIINPPQCAILAVGAIDREVYLDAGVVKDRGVMNVTLTCDHRVVDGAQAARFLAELKRLLESPAGLLM